jgi:hypothetical protein
MDKREKDMEMDRKPKPGQLYKHFKNKPYQIITVATHADTGEEMVVYQALYGDFKCYIRPLENFMSEVDHQKYPDVQQKYRFELRTPEEMAGLNTEQLINENKEAINIDLEDRTRSDNVAEMSQLPPADSVNSVLMQFLDAESYYKKLEIITSNRKHMSDRLINDMAVSLDCAVEEGPLDQRIQGLIHCLQAMSRFEDKRLR